MEMSVNIFNEILFVYVIVLRMLVHLCMYLLLVNFWSIY